MKKTLFALLACAAVMPAMAANWTVSDSYAGAYNNDRTLGNYTFYTFYLDTTDITTTLSNNTFAEFKTTFGVGACKGLVDYGTQIGFPSVWVTLSTPTDSVTNIWGVVVYNNGDDVLFAAHTPNVVEEGWVNFDYYDGQSTYVAFKPESPATPEPATATLSLMALAGLASRRRRK